MTEYRLLIEIKNIDLTNFLHEMKWTYYSFVLFLRILYGIILYNKLIIIVNNYKLINCKCHN